MSTPRVKRAFAGASSDPSQRQITSFFNARSAVDIDAAPSSEPLRGPVLPNSVQSNLLSVGMRIRKSVPEGYKTVGPSAFKLWTDNTTPGALSTKKTSSKGMGRELLPFCSINHVGGLDSQAAFESDEEDDMTLDAVPDLSMSQESNDSYTDAPVENIRKRIYDDEERADPAQAYIDPQSVWDGEVSPRSLAPSGWGNSRTLATPKSRRMMQKGSGLKQGVMADQENMALNGNDFEEAGFLVFEEGEMELGQ